MNINDLNNTKVPLVQLDPSLNEVAKQALFPEKVNKANEVLKKVGLPKKPAAHPNEAA